MAAHTFGVLWRSHQSERRRAATGDTAVFRPGFRAMEAPVAHSTPCRRTSPYPRRSSAAHAPRLVSSCASTLFANSNQRALPGEGPAPLAFPARSVAACLLATTTPARAVLAARPFGGT